MHQLVDEGCSELETETEQTGVLIDLVKSGVLLGSGFRAEYREYVFVDGNSRSFAPAL